MFVFSMRFSIKRVVALCCAAFVCAGAFWGAVKLGQREKKQEQSVAASGQITKAKVKNNAQRLAFLSAFGWQLEEEPEEVTGLLLPEEMDQVLEQYNQIQKLQGCDLEKYLGKKVKRYTYVVTNYPGQSENIRAHLFVYKDKVIGGDVCSLQVEDGFLHGFALTEATQKTNVLL